MIAKLKKNGIYLTLIAWTIVSIFPIYWMFTFSLKDNREIFGTNVIGLPQNWIWENYQVALTKGNMLLYFTNSLIVTALTIFFTTFLAIMAAYGLTRLVWKGRKQLNNIFMLGLTVPIHAAILPIFLMLKKTGMSNSYSALIIPYTAFAFAMALMMAINFMQNIPEELEEAAVMDGCGTFEVFFRVILPLMKPAFSTIGIFTFLQAWNELMFALIFISESRYRTLSVGIQTLSGAYSTSWGPIGAALVIATLPTLIFYTFLSKKIQESMMAGAVKG